MHPEGFTGENHPEVFDRPPKGPSKPGKLTDEQLNEYYEKGYTVVRDFFTKEELNCVVEEVNILVSKLADKLLAAGKIKDKHDDLGFYERLTAIENECPGAGIMLHKSSYLTPGMQAIAAHEKMLNLMEDILGPDIAFHPVWNLRTKTPLNAATVVPWHQDNAYTDNNSYKIHIASAWIPLIDATAENGTLQMVKGAHKNGLTAIHTCCAGPTWYLMLEEEEMVNRLGVDLEKDSEIIEIPMGSFILFNNFTPHQSLPNKSDKIRWALDFRWQKADTPACFYGVKDKCIVRLGDQPDYKPDFDSFNGVDRQAKSHELCSDISNEDFDTIITGPWMHRWEIVHHNRHTESLKEGNSTSWHNDTIVRV